MSEVDAGRWGQTQNISWPKDFSPESADSFVHNEIDILATRDHVWNKVVDVARWPEWYPNSEDAHIVGSEPVLGPKSIFRWTTFGMPLESRVDDFEAGSRLAWFGGGVGADPGFYHVWRLVPVGDACHLMMEEVGRGPAAAKMHQEDAGLHWRTHEMWLATLKWVAESY